MTEATAKDKKRNGWYYANDKAYVGVTTVINVVDKSNALIPWATKIVALAARAHPEWSVEKLMAEPYAQRDAKADIGTTVHSLAEAIGRGNIPDVKTITESFRGYAGGVVDFHKRCVKRVLFSESTGYNDKEGYAGTMDEIFEGYDNLNYLADYKTGKYLYKTGGLQLSAYKHCEFIMDNATKKRIPMPRIDKLIGIKLGEDGTVGTQDYSDGYDRFLEALGLYRWHFVDDVMRAIKLTEGDEV